MNAKNFIATVGTGLALGFAAGQNLGGILGASFGIVSWISLGFRGLMR